MTDEELIFKFLDSNYSVTIDGVAYVCVDLDSQKQMVYESRYGSMVNVFNDIIGDFICDTGEASTNVLKRWYRAKSKIIGQKIYDFLNTYDGNDSFDNLYKEIEDKLSNEFGKPFLKNELYNHYRDNYLKDKVDAYLIDVDLTKGSKISLDKMEQFFNGDIDSFKGDIVDSFNKKYSEFIINEVDKYLTNINKDITSEKLVSDFWYNVNDETEHHRHIVVKILKDWYAVNVLDDKLIPFFNELIVTMGSTNWLVTWIGHGKLTEEKMLNHFRDEDSVSKNYIRQRYEDWYADKIIEVSDRYIKNAW